MAIRGFVPGPGAQAALIEVLSVMARTPRIGPFAFSTTSGQLERLFRQSPWPRVRPLVQKIIELLKSDRTKVDAYTWLRNLTAALDHRRGPSKPRPTSVQRTKKPLGKKA